MIRTQIINLMYMDLSTSFLINFMNDIPISVYAKPGGENRAISGFQCLLLSALFVYKCALAYFKEIEAACFFLVSFPTQIREFFDVAVKKSINFPHSISAMVKLIEKETNRKVGFFFDEAQVLYQYVGDEKKGMMQLQSLNPDKSVLAVEFKEGNTKVNGLTLLSKSLFKLSFRRHLFFSGTAFRMNEAIQYMESPLLKDGEVFSPTFKLLGRLGVEEILRDSEVGFQFDQDLTVNALSRFLSGRSRWVSEFMANLISKAVGRIDLSLAKDCVEFISDKLRHNLTGYFEHKLGSHLGDEMTTVRSVLTKMVENGRAAMTKDVFEFVNYRLMPLVHVGTEWEDMLVNEFGKPEQDTIICTYHSEEPFFVNVLSSVLKKNPSMDTSLLAAVVESHYSYNAMIGECVVEELLLNCSRDGKFLVDYPLFEQLAGTRFRTVRLAFKGVSWAPKGYLHSLYQDDPKYLHTRVDTYHRSDLVGLAVDEAKGRCIVEVSAKCYASKIYYKNYCLTLGTINPWRAYLSDNNNRIGRNEIRTLYHAWLNRVVKEERDFMSLRLTMIWGGVDDADLGGGLWLSKDEKHCLVHIDHTKRNLLDGLLSPATMEALDVCCRLKERSIDKVEKTLITAEQIGDDAFGDSSGDSSDRKFSAKRTLPEDCRSVDVKRRAIAFEEFVSSD